jgi:hypothetical protein
MGKRGPRQALAGRHLFKQIIRGAKKEALKAPFFSNNFGDSLSVSPHPFLNLGTLFLDFTKERFRNPISVCGGFCVVGSDKLCAVLSFCDVINFSHFFILYCFPFDDLIISDDFYFVKGIFTFP